MAPLKVGLVGPGAISAAHAQAIASVDGLELVAVAGGAPEALAARFGAGVRGYATHAAMLADARPDIVAVATPSGDHFAPAAAALAAGAHVLVEKPLCVDPHEAARLVGLARASGRICATVSQRRFEPAHRHLRAQLAAGALGRLRLIEADVHWWRSDAYYAEKPWRGEIGQGGGSLFNQGVHSLDLMLFLAGPVARVCAMSTTIGHAIEVEDLTAATIAFESGALGVLVTSTATPPGAPAGLRLFTDRGHCEIAQEETRVWRFEGVAPPPAASGVGSGASDPGAIGVAGHIAQWTDLRDAIRTGRAPAVTFEEGCAATRTVAAIYRAARERREVALSEFPVSA